jgi:hypothetical protein
MESLALLRAQTGRLLFIAVIMQMLLGLSQVPFLGILVIISVPGLGAGLLEAFHVTSRGGAPAISLLFKPLASPQHRGRLFAMGALVFVIAVVTISVLLPASGSLPDEALLLRLQQGDVDALSELDPAFVSNLLMAFMVSIGISGTLSYMSIPLIWFKGRKLWPAIGEGMRALLVHWKAFLVLGVGVMALFLPVALLSSILLQLAAAGGVMAMVFTGLLMALLLLFQLVLFGTQYCAAKEIFGVDDEVIDEPPSPGDDQLVA